VEATELDVTNIKGHLLIGQILAEIGKKQGESAKLELSIVRMKKGAYLEDLCYLLALTLCAGQNKTKYEH